MMPETSPSARNTRPVLRSGRRSPRKQPSQFACPRCHRVVTGLLEVRYAIGLADLDPKLMCEADVDELRDEEAAYLAGDFQTSRPVWSIEIVRRIGDAAAVDVSPHRAAATSSTRIALPAPRPRRVSLGGVEL
jgi:hypothetical protein